MEEWELNIHFFWVVEYHGAEITRFNDGHDDSEGDVKLSWGVVFWKKNNLNRVFDVTWEIFQSKDIKTLSQYYANFNKIYEEAEGSIFHHIGCE